MVANQIQKDNQSSDIINKNNEDISKQKELINDDLKQQGYEIQKRREYRKKERIEKDRKIGTENFLSTIDNEENQDKAINKELEDQTSDIETRLARRKELKNKKS